MRLDQPGKLLFAAAVTLALLGGKGADRAIDKAAAAIGEAPYREQIASLSADEFEGRSPGTAGEQRTVEYLEEQFLEMGLQPVDGGSFRQDVSLVEITASNHRLSFSKGGGSVALAFGDDMVLGTRRVRGESSIANSEVVFVGYGIDAPEYGWNDYAGLDMRGKTALILVNDPGFVTGDEALFRGRALTYHGRWTYKFEEAARQGAAAAIIVHDTAPAAYDWGVVRNGWTGPQFYADRADGNAGRSALEGWITLDRARQVVELAGQDLDALRAAAARRGFKPVALGITATGGVHNTIRRMRSPNVVGVMPGKDQPDEYVIYVAHWDHLGVAEEPGVEDRIYNGAVDNATGVAGILTIARAFRDLMPGPARSVMFIALTAEESGLIGSEFYAEHPLVPLERTAAVINIDALNPFGRAKDVEVIGFGASGLEDLLAAAAKSQGRTLTADERPEAGYFYRSDHFNFAKAGVPALYIKSGKQLREGPAGAGMAMLEDYVANRYHKPGDAYVDSWNVAGSIEDLKLLFAVGARVANSETWPEWYEGNEFRAIRDRSAAVRVPAKD
jgi:Zn-dependent M28 family amino/carboxypeptidase